eukprot:6467991-Amphidinium_carterae.1
MTVSTVSKCWYHRLGRKVAFATQSQPYAISPFCWQTNHTSKAAVVRVSKNRPHEVFGSSQLKIEGIRSIESHAKCGAVHCGKRS